MADLHLSKSEVFWHGALYERLFRLTQEYAEEKNSNQEFRKEFKLVADILGESAEPYETIEALALECGLACQVELIAAGDNLRYPSDAEFRNAVPEDAHWSLADGTAASTDEVEHICETLCNATSGAFNACQESGVALTDLDRKEQFVDSMNGGLTPVSRNSLERHLYHIIDAHGPWAACGYAHSTPDKLYFLNWLGQWQRFTVAQQTNPSYAALLTRFSPHLPLPPYVRISLIEQHARNGGRIEELIPPGWTPAPISCAVDSIEARSVDVGVFLDKLCHRFQETADWGLGRLFARATRSGTVLEALIIRNRELLSQRHCLPYVELPAATRNRIEALEKDLLDWMHICNQESQRLAQEPSPEGLNADTRRRLSIDARFLLGSIIDDLRIAAELARDEGLTDATTAISSACSVAIALKQKFRQWLSGGIDGAILEKSVHQLTAMVRDAMKLAYGMLYFKELAADCVYIDPATRVKMLRQPRAVRTQIAEAVSQYERQMLANCTVTSLVGLIEPIAREINLQWNPRARYGTTAEMLKQLLDHLRAQRESLKPAHGDNRPPTPEENENLLKLYCVNLAFGLHELTNSVRHYPDKVLDRHDAGVMLHGLCVLLKRMNAHTPS